VAQVVAITAVGAAWLVIGVCLAIIVAAVTVITAVNEFRVWLLRRRGLDRCRFCGTLLTPSSTRPSGFRWGS
jgi:hypothetical protein